MISNPRIIGLGLIAATIIASSTEAAQPSAADFYISPSGNDAWSGRLAEPNGAGNDGPFATLVRARDAVRSLVKEEGGLKRDVVVLLHGGVYRFREPVAFGVEDSGTAEHSITYAAYPGEYSVLSGGAPVGGWQKWKGEIYRAASPTNRGVNQLFADGKAQVRARHPNLDPEDPIARGWLYMKDVPGTDRGSRAPLATRGFIYEEGDVPDWKDLTGAEVSAYSWTNYSHDVSPLVSINRERRQVNLQRNGGLAFKPKNRYFFQNVREALDQPGEYYSNPKTGEIYFWPVKPEDLEKVTVPTAESLLFVKGDAKAGLVRNLHFKGLTFAETLKSGCVLAGVARCSVEDCLFTNLGGTALVVNLDAEDNVIAGNEFCYLGEGGIVLNGYPPGGRDATTRNVIRNNHIHHCGRIQKGAGSAAISLSNASRTLVEHNLVHDMPYVGIMWGGGAMLKYYTEAGKQPWAFKSNKINGIVVTRENIKGFFQGRNNIIQKNHVYNCCLEVSDGGCLYSWASGLNNTVRNNLVHDVVGFYSDGPDQFHFLAMGIYLDDESDQHVVENNVVFRVSNYGILIHNAVGNSVLNNVVADCGTSLIYFLNETQRSGDNRVEKNIAACADWPVDLVGITPIMPAHAKCDRNLYFNGKNPPRFRCGNAMTLDQWRALGQDARSLVADPWFADPAHDNFALREDSPAFKIGHRPIDLSDVGLLKDWGQRPESPVGRAARLEGPKPPPFFSRNALEAVAMARESARSHRIAVITRIEAPIRADGDLSDWPQSVKAVPLVMQQSPKGDIVQTRGLAYVARDAGNFYVALEADVPDLSLLEKSPADSCWGKSYCAEICFRIDRSNIHVLHGFASGHHEAVALGGVSPEKLEALAGHYQYGAKVVGNRWFGEWAIPFKAAGLDPARTARIRFNMAFCNFARKEWACWVGANGPAYYVDDAGTLILSPSVAAPNLLRNPSCGKQPGGGPWYEDGWDTGNAPPEKKALLAFADEGPDGSSCLKIVGRDGDAMQNILAIWRQKILNPAFGTYRLSYWLKTQKLSAAQLDAGFGAYAYLADPKTKTGVYLAQREGWVECKDLPWERREIILDVSSGFPELWISFGMRKCTGIAWIDDVRLEKCE